MFTIEPFPPARPEWAGTGEDGWTPVAAPGNPRVRYEHTLAVTGRGPLVLTTVR